MRWMLVGIAALVGIGLVGCDCDISAPESWGGGRQVGWHLPGMDRARLELRQAIQAAGGVEAVASAMGVHYTTLYRYLAGGDMEPERRKALRAALPKVPARVWADLYAPRSS